MEKTLQEKVIDAITDIRPVLQRDGGDVLFIKMEGKTVHVALQGHCNGCEFADMTVKSIIESCLKEKTDPDLRVISEVIEEP